MRKSLSWLPDRYHRCMAIAAMSFRSLAGARPGQMLIFLMCASALVLALSAAGESADADAKASASASTPKEAEAKSSGKTPPDWFHALDANKDGGITIDEAGPGLKPYFNDVDSNKDGVVDRAESIAAAEEARRRPRTRAEAAQWPPAVKPGTAPESYSPPARADYPTQVFWGDTHLHTNVSVDANGMGNRLLTPDDAFRFAKGEAITAHNGMEARLRRPLDFLVVADHAENLGVLPRIQAGDPLILKTEVGKRWAKLLKENPIDTGALLNADSPVPRAEAGWSIGTASGQPASFFWRAWSLDAVRDEPFRRSVWEQVCNTADRHYDPGRFTAFIGYEYTPPTQHAKAPNFHRIIIFEGNAKEAGKVLPFSYIDSTDIEDLWAFLSNYEKGGGKVLAIPHNGNLSSGKMFQLLDIDGSPFSADYAGRRARWEPLYEVTQYKGDAETHPLLSPTDEFADFETWNGPIFNRTPLDKRAEQKRYEYARSALKLGLDQKSKLGVNPFKFGMIGSTDAHTSLSTAAEENVWGKTSMMEPSAYRAYDSWRYSASGYAGVWAQKNTRASIFAAMRRKEVYASTGPRITVRFFGGWDFAEKDAFDPDVARIGYARGVPMGGDLTNSGNGGSPVFLVRAVKDPDGANLDRAQVIKGWRSAAGELHERVYDVAVSDGRTIPEGGGKVKPVGSTVDVDNATYDNTIGDPELAVVWTDPDFDPEELAFYYVRVIEIPKPRWTAYDRKFFKLKDLPVNIPMVVQDRAYTSPIWYTP